MRVVTAWRRCLGRGSARFVAATKHPGFLDDRDSGADDVDRHRCRDSRLRRRHSPAQLGLLPGVGTVLSLFHATSLITIAVLGMAYGRKFACAN